MNWIKKEDPTICCLQETHLNDRNKHRLRMKGWKKIYQANGSPKQAGIAIHISNKADFKLALIKQDKEGYSILIKGEIHQKGNNNYQPICTKCQCTQFHKTYPEELKEYINSNTVVVGHVNTPLSSIARSSNKKSIKKSYI
jgi:exonuclease III